MATGIRRHRTLIVPLGLRRQLFEEVVELHEFRIARQSSRRRAGDGRLELPRMRRGPTIRSSAG